MEKSSGDQSVLGVEICYLVALAVAFIITTYGLWWVTAPLPLWYARTTSGLTNNSNTAWKIRVLSVHSRGYCCSIWWMHHMLVALLWVFWEQNSLKSFHCSFSETMLGREVEEPPSCCTVSMKLLPQMLSWLLVTVSEMAAAFCKSGLKIDLFGYACSLKGTLSVWFSPNILAWLLSAMPSLLSRQPIWPALQWVQYSFTYRQICFEYSAINIY